MNKIRGDLPLHRSPVFIHFAQTRDFKIRFCNACFHSLTDGNLPEYYAFIDGINLRLDAIWDEYKRDEVINLVSLFIYMKIFTCKRKNIPYLECLSTKTLWWTTLQLPYILMHRIREITW